MGKPHHNLEVWKRALNFVTKIYKITAQFPDGEKSLEWLREIDQRQGQVIGVKYAESFKRIEVW